MGGENNGNTGTEPVKGTATASSSTITLRTPPVNLNDGPSSPLDFEIDTEAIAKAYKEELVNRMDSFWGLQMREVGV